MRPLRITGKDRFERPAFHVMSRGYDRNWILESKEEKEMFRAILDRTVKFTGVELLTFCILGNHFHCLVRIHPMPSEGYSDEELIARMRQVYSDRRMMLFLSALKKAREADDEEAAEALRAPVLARMHDLSMFMKELKQRYSQWYNQKKGRKGALWEDRFKSVLVEDGQALLTMAKYIDLNPVRAGIVDDPKDYRWCGYGEATAGRKAARAGLCSLFPHPRTNEPRDWNEIKTLYRMAIFAKGVQYTLPNGQTKTGVDPEKVREVWDKGGKLSWDEVVWVKTRFLTDSLVFGSRGFVEDVAEVHSGMFGKIRPRRDKAHPAASTGLLDMCTLKKFRDGHIGPPGD